MLPVIGELDRNEVAQLLSAAVCVSYQSSDSADMQNKGNKFAISLYILKMCPGEILHAFLGIAQSEK